MGRNSFHGSTLHGNLVRLLILFHFPITTYSCYQLTLDSSIASITSKALAALSFAFLSVLIPAWLLFRVATTSTSKLYDATRTLLALGPLYNEYQHESQLFAGMMFAANLCLGVVVGCGQQSGTAQAIIILVVEVVVTLSSSIWLPWMHGAQMGVISFIFCVARIIAAVLMVILARPVRPSIRFLRRYSPRWVGGYRESSRRMDRIYCLGYPRHRLRGVRPDAHCQSAGGDCAYYSGSTILGFATRSRNRLAWCNGLLCFFQTQQKGKTWCPPV